MRIARAKGDPVVKRRARTPGYLLTWRKRPAGFASGVAPASADSESGRIGENPSPYPLPQGEGAWIFSSPPGRGFCFLFFLAPSLLREGVGGGSFFASNDSEIHAFRTRDSIDHSGAPDRGAGAGIERAQGRADFGAAALSRRAGRARARGAFAGSLARRRGVGRFGPPEAPTLRASAARSRSALRGKARQAEGSRPASAPFRQRGALPERKKREWSPATGSNPHAAQAANALRRIPSGSR